MTHLDSQKIDMAKSNHATVSLPSHVTVLQRIPAQLFTAIITINVEYIVVIMAVFKIFTNFLNEGCLNAIGKGLNFQMISQTIAA